MLLLKNGHVHSTEEVSVLTPSPAGENPFKGTEASGIKMCLMGNPAAIFAGCGPLYSFLCTDLIDLHECEFESFLVVELTCVRFALRNHFKINYNSRNRHCSKTI